MQQLDLFDVNKLEQAKEIKQAIYERLKHYGIDDYFNKNIKGKFMSLKEISAELNSLPNYRDYYIELVYELIQVVPLMSFDNWLKQGNCNCLIKIDRNKYSFYCDSSGGMYRPLNCLEEIPEDFFT